MDPMNNPLPNPNPAANGMAPNADANAGVPMGAMDNSGASLAGMQPGHGVGGMAPNNSSFALPGQGQPMGVPSAPMGGDMTGGIPTAPVGSPVPPVAPSSSPSFNIPTQPGGSMSAGQMFQPTGGVSTPMGALGAVPGDYGSANSPLLGATDPITMPAPPKAPDPIEEELKAPFKAAGPVPGSIGSAVSMPGDPNQSPNNVGFNDPASMAPNSAVAQKGNSFLSKLGIGGDKKADKKSIILLAVVAILLVGGIVAVVLIGM